MARKQTQGKCELCGEVLRRRAMASHLEKHRADNGVSIDVPGAERLFQLRVQGTYNADFWLYLEIPAEARLKVLDQFLRNIWLECCGHLSKFSIGGMSRKLGDVLEIGITFGHEYDFGDTTELTLEVIAEYAGFAPASKVPVRLLARNEIPFIPCDECGAMAQQVCVLCPCERGEGWLCDQHATEHDCEDEMFLPVVNSPRVGQCGYTGD